MCKCVVVLSAHPSFERLSKVRSDVENKYSIISVSPTIPSWSVDIPNIKFLKDSHFLVRNIFHKTNLPRQKWYYQQFLKYEIILSLKEFEQVHIIDGDSILQKELYFDHTSRFTPIKINEAYIRYLKKLGINPRDTNFITNEMSFKRAELVEMLTQLECTRENYIEQLAKKIDENSWFSEYQLYAIFKTEKKQVESAIIKVFRRYELIPEWMTVRFKRRYALVAYETHHSKSSLRKIRAISFYLLNKNLG